jgi:HAD superfamily hydrolase (TIGR01450 family)
VTTWLIDLDGVVWLGDAPIAGSADALTRLVARGDTVAYCTNNSSTTVPAYRDKLARHGLPGDEILTSALAAANLVEPGERVLVCADRGVVEALTERGATPVEAGRADAGPCDAVVVGFHRSFDYDRMKAATRAVLGGARLIATNDDPIYPDADGPSPGNGAILASIERATGRRAIIAGKPHQPMVDLVHERLGPTAGIMVGDSPSTDGGLAAALGWPFVLVLTGNTTAAQAVAVGADLVVADLAAAVAADPPTARL